jgi:glycosyltransferase involved in cell wall biosynthesis
LKTRILYVLPAGEKGGAEVVFLNIVENLDRNVFEPFVIVLKDGPFISEIRKHNVIPVVLNTNRIRSIKSFFETTRSIGKIIESEKIDVVHCNGTGAQIYGGFAAGLTGTPCIYHLHDSVEWSWSRQGLVHLLAQLSFSIPRTLSRHRSPLHFIAVSKHIAEKFQQTWGPKKTVHVIHNAIRSTDAVTPPSINQHPVIVWIGRLQRWKGAHIFIKAAGIVHKQYPEVQFKIVGGSLFGIEADYEKELHDLAQSLKLEKVLTFTGHQSSTGKFIQSADVVVHSSIRPEPFGLVILEAMNAGKPVIASSEGGPLEIVEHRITGLLIRPNDPEKLADAITTVLLDSSMRAKMGAAAQERVKEHFSAAKMIHSLEALYSELAAEKVEQLFQNEHHQEKNISRGIRQRL